MLEELRDLYAHMAWADAVHWHVVGKHEAARDDEAVRGRIHHIVTVQRAFHSLIRGEAPKFRELSEYESLEEVRKEVVSFHEEAAGFLESADEARLGAKIEVPWFREPAGRVSTKEAMTQVAMHSQNHRGQNATRFRELGLKAPTTDYIVWLWKERPKPRWE